MINIISIYADNTYMICYVPKSNALLINKAIFSNNNIQKTTYYLNMHIPHILYKYIILPTSLKNKSQ